MSKRYETIELFGKTFELDTKETVAYVPIPYRTIFDVCGKPSMTKVYIYREWEEWFNKHNGFADVCSHNSYFFSIQGYVNDWDNRKKYYCYITPSHNRCIEVE